MKRCIFQTHATTFSYPKILFEELGYVNLTTALLINGTTMMITYISPMSCVNSSDILKLARNTLNQYPRFWLDGKDAISWGLCSRESVKGGEIRRSTLTV
ncbi:unnamed protein product [Eruca vesicaria subsp. sativa]|uniref:Uncharacterized protein n=1 Tax=Eruca vesicaria subsp. sativa TaxID=29727 RepID=A0ABC8J889_ERUVS|nr:unnamed protein product [Eruca vesicaria subsp. sativa]